MNDTRNAPYRDAGSGDQLRNNERPTYEKPRAPMAVALHYTGRGAPRVVAKGGGYIAQHIIDTAKRHNVPLEEDPALVGALSKIDLGREIPRELWIAVAHVLAFAWSVSGKKKI